MKLYFITLLATFFCLSAFANPFAGKQPDFSFTRGWLGSDLAYSVKLTEDKYLWLFGDSFVLVPDEDNHAYVEMIPSSVGIATIDEHGQHQMEYAWRGQGTEKTRAVFPHAKKTDGFLYWPKDAILVNNKLYVALVEIQALDTSDALGFVETQTYLAEVMNPHENPGFWNYNLVSFSPHPSVYAGTRFIQKGDYVYWFSTIKDSEAFKQELAFGEYHKMPMVLQRVPADKMDRLSEFQEYLSEEGQWVQGYDHNSARRVMEHAATEMTVHWSDHFNKWIAIYGESGLASNKVVVRIADNLEGPWSEQKEVFTFPEMLQSDSRYVKHGFGYAAKFHPQFVDPEKPHIVPMTYVINTLGVERLFKGRGVTSYVPKIVNLDLTNTVEELSGILPQKANLTTKIRSKLNSVVKACSRVLKGL